MKTISQFATVGMQLNLTNRVNLLMSENTSLKFVDLHDRQEEFVLTNLEQCNFWNLELLKFNLMGTAMSYLDFREFKRLRQLDITI